MIEHSDLVEEMARVEKMPITDRIKLAQKRRRQQLQQYSKWAKTDPPEVQGKGKRGIVFAPDIQLMDAAARGVYDEMLELLKKGVDPNLKNHDGLTALHQCCIDGTTEMVKLLLQYGADVNITDNDLWTPLHAAATCGHLQIVTELVKSGAHLTAVNGDGDMPHDITEEEVTLQYLENEMIKQGVDEAAIDKIRNEKHNSLLVHVSTLLSSGGDINQPVDQGGTFLHMAIAHGFNDIMQLLLEAKADPTIPDLDGWQPIHVAVYWGNEEAMELLASDSSVNLRATTKIGEIPYELCDDPNIKYRLIQLLSERTSIYEEQISVEEDTTIDNQLNNHIEEELSQTDQVSEPDQQDASPPNQDDVPSSPLVNIELSSDRRSSVREAKHLAPIKRMNSIRSSNREKRRTSDDSHPLGQEPKVTIMPEIDIPPQNPTGISTISKYYEVVPEENKPQPPPRTRSPQLPPPPSSPPPPPLQSQPPPQPSSQPPPQQESFYVEPLSTIKDWKQSDTSNSDVEEIRVEKTAAQTKEPKTSDNKQKENGEAKVFKVEESAKGKENKGDGKEKSMEDQENKEGIESIGGDTLIRIRRKKKHAPPPPTGSLLDLKLQRQSLREESQRREQEGIQQGQGQGQQTSTFYKALSTPDVRLYEAPPSPTAIRYHFKMVDDKEKPTRLFIKQKKCAIM